MSHIQQITLDLIPNGEMPILYASQYDAGRSFRANIVERKIPYTLDGTELISLTVRKGDGNLVTMDIANIFANKTYIDFVSTEQMTAISGSNFGELHLESNGVSIGTLNFYLMVEPAADEGGVTSHSEINNLRRQVNEMVDDEIEDDLSYYYTKEAADDKFATKTALNELSEVVDTKASTEALQALAETTAQALALKANTSDVNTALALKADKATTYNKTEVDNLVAPKADKSYVDSELATKADQATTYSKAEVNALINALPTPMVFKGTLGTGGTITTLPSASAENEGYTYKVITAGTYQGIVCKVGDVVTSNGSTWVLIPSGDTDSDTWRAIKINGTEKLGNAISTGAVDFEQGDNITITFDADGNKIIVATTGIYTKAEVDALIAGKCDYPTETASGTIASFNTDLASALKECEVSFTAYQASGTPTPSTPIPISGFSSAKLFRTNTNIWGGLQMANDVVNAINNSSYSTTGEDANGKYFTLKASSEISGKAFFERFKANTQYTLIMKVSKETNPSNKTCNLVISYTDGTSTAISVQSNFSDQNVQTVAITSTSGKTVKEIKGGWYSGTNRFYYENCGLFEGAISTIDFVAYNGTSVVIPFGDTYYGGVLDVVRGKLRVLNALFTPTNTMTIFGAYRNAYDCWVFTCSESPTIFKTNGEVLSNVNIASLYNQIRVSGFAYAVSDKAVFSLADSDSGLNASSSVSDVQTAFQTFVSTYSPYAVYELATPIEIDLTPEQIATLVGDNNVFCDIPTSSVEVAFKVSIEKYINDLLNP